MTLLQTLLLLIISVIAMFWFIGVVVDYIHDVLSKIE